MDQSVLRQKFPLCYKFYQETIGEIYHEFFCFGSILRRLSTNQLLKLEQNTFDPVRISYDFKGFGLYKKIEPFQIEEEIRGLYEIVKEQKPKIICEIGSDMGGTLYMWSKAMDPNGMAISIDLPRLYRKSLNRFFKNFFQNNSRIEYIRYDSHLQICLRKFEKILKNREIDFLFIDGDHSYKGVNKDFEMYSRYVKNNGIIAFHDIVKDNTPEDICGVHRFWNEIKQNYKYKEIIADPNQTGAGIGILYC
ncbi:MAG: class I SAM-dependent methyltransferase [Deltaproteobacteria bacterium]|nr:class I SAM-dependent methyltransferase [Deltaproteobacteria bacterium]MBW2200826.1 class I SAM-dependent methyltransferase [Deltaproteobacteria bacterium]